MDLRASGQLEKAPSTIPSRRRPGKHGSAGHWVSCRGWSRPSGLHIPAVVRRASAPEVPRRLEPNRNVAFNAALKRCSTQNQAPPIIKVYAGAIVRMPYGTGIAAAGVKDAAATRGPCTTPNNYL